jgi:thiosulfate dehydrogenase
MSDRPIQRTTLRSTVLATGRPAVLATVLAFVLAAAASCGPEPAAERGRALCTDPRLSQSPSNVFACTTCHATSAAEQEARRLPGHPLVGAAARPAFWGGGQSYLLDAVNQCFVDFMRGERLGPEDPRGLALLAYLRSLAPSPDAARPCTVVRNVDSAYLSMLPAGSAARGEASYQKACAYCHGRPHSGDGKLGPRISTLPEDTVASFGAMARSILVEKVRHGKYFSVGGVMPLYCTEVLSDAELADIVAYLLP